MHLSIFIFDKIPWNFILKDSDEPLHLFKAERVTIRRYLSRSLCIVSEYLNQEIVASIDLDAYGITGIYIACYDDSIFVTCEAHISYLCTTFEYERRRRAFALPKPTFNDEI